MPSRNLKPKEDRRPKVVFDTNVLVSSLIRSGKPRELWNEVLEGKIRLVTSDELFSEFSKVIRRTKFRKYTTQSDMARFLILLRQHAEVASIKTRFKAIKQDPYDNIVLETSYSAEADYIVSGDKHLLALEEFKETKIVTIDEMLQILKVQLKPDRE